MEIADGVDDWIGNGNVYVLWELRLVGIEIELCNGASWE